MHISVTPEQHTHSVKQLLKNINTNPESLKELGQWGLEIGSQILMVSVHYYWVILQLSSVLCTCLHVCRCSALFYISSIGFPFCRFKVEVYLLKPSASRLHLLQQAQIFPGPERSPDMSPSAVWGIVSFWTVQIHFYWWWCVHIDKHTPPHTKRVLIDYFFIHFILDSPQYLGHLLSSPLCRADWGAGYNFKEGGRTYWCSYGEAHVGGAERWSHWDLCEEHSVSPQ